MLFYLIFMYMHLFMYCDKYGIFRILRKNFWVYNTYKSLSDNYNTDKATSWVNLYFGGKEENKLMYVVNQLGYPILCEKSTITTMR